MEENKSWKKADKEERTYCIEGQGDLPSVTTILGQLDKSGALMGWVAKITYNYLIDHQEELKTAQDPTEVFKKAKTYYKEIQQTALDFGSALHNLIEVYLKEQKVDGLLEENTLLNKPFEQFKEWQKKYNFELIQSEHIIWSEMRYAGTLDCVARLNDKLYVVDFKSSKAIYDDYLWQISAYMKAYEERTNGEVAGLGILRLPKNTDDVYEWREYTLEQANDAFDCFMHLCSLWWAKKMLKK